MLIKDPAGEAVWNETEAIEPGEKFNKTYGLLDPFEEYTAVIVPVVDGEDQSPVEENFTTGFRYCYFALQPTTRANTSLFRFSSGQGIVVSGGHRRGRGFLERGSGCKRRFDRRRLVQTDPSERFERRAIGGLFVGLVNWIFPSSSIIGCVLLENSHRKWNVPSIVRRTGTTHRLRDRSLSGRG